jgi:hypothetical protein
LRLPSATTTRRSRPPPGRRRRHLDEGPSWRDFAATDLPDIVERFAADWDHLPPLIRGRGDYRLLIGAGRVVSFYAVEAQLAGDGSIELVGVEIDLGDTPSEGTD